MRTTNIAELKNYLSSFLADVKRGEEILISNRNQPIAIIVPYTTLRIFPPKN